MARKKRKATSDCAQIHKRVKMAGNDHNSPGGPGSPNCAKSKPVTRIKRRKLVNGQKLEEPRSVPKRRLRSMQANGNAEGAQDRNDDGQPDVNPLRKQLEPSRSKSAKKRKQTVKRPDEGESKSEENKVVRQQAVVAEPQEFKELKNEVIDNCGKTEAKTAAGECSKNTSLAAGHNNSDQSSSESEWEEVQEGNPETEEDEREPVIPKEGVEITITLPDSQKRKAKKKFDVQAYFRRLANRIKKEVCEDKHKVHLLCLLASGFWIETVLDKDVVRACALSSVPSHLVVTRQEDTKQESLEKLLFWYNQEFTFNVGGDSSASLSFDVQAVIQAFQRKATSSKAIYVCILLSCFRIAGYAARLLWSFQPSPIKIPTSSEKRKESPDSSTSTGAAVGAKSQDSGSSQKDRKTGNGQEHKRRDVGERQDRKTGTGQGQIRKDIVERQETQNRKGKPNVTEAVPKISKEKSSDPKGDSRRRSSRSSKNKVDYKERESEESDCGNNESQDSNARKLKIQQTSLKNSDEANTDDDFEVVVVKVRKPGPLKGLKRNRKALSSDEESKDGSKGDLGNDRWIEVYAPWSRCWITIDCLRCSIAKPQDMEAGATKPLLYVMAFEGVGHVKDVTRRYASGWLSSTRKQRVDATWWDETLSPFPVPNSERDKLEDDLLQDQLLERPLPTAISEFKDHPLYALKRHLLKFQCIYPSEAVPVGYIRGEPIYSRECVRTLHSRETWLKQARVVKLGETPYKVVKARPKWIPATREIKTDIPLEIFGKWQTEDYVPPVARDGKVPRNDFGNVDMFQPSMLPIGTVHLQVPGLNRVAKKLNIDCAPAMIGWDFRGWGSHPTFDGWIVCEEFKETLMEAWVEDQAIAEQREREKIDKRVYGNWRRLIRGLLIRERLRLKYPTEAKEDFQDPGSKPAPSKGSKAKSIRRRRN